MKDDHDNVTHELPHMARGGGFSSPPVPPAQYPMYVAQQRARLEMETYLPVTMVAKDWGVIPRRIRALLAAGRLAGRQQDNGYWEVRYPYTVTEGRRGPQMKRRAPKKPVLKLV